MKPRIRRERIVDLVRERERVSVDDLAALMDASRETIRRDLTDLADRGRIRKFHGGASLPDNVREGSFPARLTEAAREKRAVAARAAALFAAGDTLFVDVGTTTLAFAEELARRGAADLTVITNGLEIAHLLAEGGAEAFVVGGLYRPDAREMVGPLAVAQIGGFHAAHAVLTVAALNAGGALDFRLEEAEVARAMVRQAASVTVVADGGKLGRTALFQVAPLGRIDRLVTDRPPQDELGAALDAAGVEVILADEGAESDRGG